MNPGKFLGQKHVEKTAKSTKKVPGQILQAQIINGLVDH
jgi:hypothetical protein